MVGYRSGRSIQGVVLATLFAAQGVVSLPVLAQDSVGDPVSAPEVICMSRTPEAPAQTVDAPQPIHVLATAADAEALQKKGFTTTDCAAVDLASTTSRSDWRDQICTLASQGNQAVQNQLEAMLGERPAVLCAMAEQTAGEWRRGAATQ